MPVGDVRRFEGELLELRRAPRTARCSSGMRSDPKADVPAELGDVIDAFKEQFDAATAAGPRRSIRTATDGGRESGEAPPSAQDLATE